MAISEHVVTASVYVPAHTVPGHYTDAGVWVPAAQVPGAYTPLEVVTARLALSESWAPYALGEVQAILPTDAALLSAIDPRAGGRLRLELEQRYGASDPLAVISGAWPNPGTLADLSAAWPNPGTLADLSARYGTPYNAFGWRSTARTADLGIRSRSTDLGSGTITLTVASDELLLQDVAWFGDTPYDLVGPSVAAAVNTVLATVGAQLHDAVDAVLTDYDPDGFKWTPGQSGWDVLDTLVQAGGLRLWCDEARQWHLGLPQTASNGPGVHVDANAVQVTEDLSRDSDWCDAVVVEYRWVSADGLEHVRYDRAGTPTPTRVVKVERPVAWAGNGAAAAQLARAKTRGLSTSVRAVSAYDVAPGQTLTVTTVSGAQAGYIESVEWSFPDDEMDVVSRDLDVVDAYAWEAQKPQYPWNAVPAGVSWTTYTPAPPD